MNKRYSTWRTASGGLSLGFSAYKRFQECPRAFYWEQLHGGLGIKRKNEDYAPALWYGKLFHALYSARLAELDPRAAFESACVLDGVSPQSFEPLYSTISEDLEWYYNQERGTRIAVLSNEQELHVDVVSPRTGLTHTLRGTPDLVAQVEADWGSGVYVIDHKTFVGVSRDGKVYTEPKQDSVVRQKHSRQFPCYMGLWNALHPEARTTDGILNFVPQRAAEAERKLSTRAGNVRRMHITREFIVLDEDRVQLSIADWTRACDDIVAYMEEGPQAFHERENQNACVGPWRSCPQLELCEAPRDLQDAHVSAAFEQRKVVELS